MGTKYAGIPEPSLRTPPLGGTSCPDPRWAAARGLVLQGPTYFLGARWVLELGGVAIPGVPAPPPVAGPAPEGGILFVDVLPDPATQATGAPPEGGVMFVDEITP